LADDDFRYFEIDTYRDAAIAADPVLSAQSDAAIALLYALQTGEMPASQVFDVVQYGRFLALVDLWGATEATSLINLSFYYDAATGKLEPVAFSANPLGGTGRVSLAATYDDPQIQAAYAREAVRISDPSYLETLRKELEPALEQVRREVGASARTSESLWERLTERQGLMRRSLDPVDPVFAYLETPASPPYDALHVDVGNALNLPLEVLGFDINGATFIETDRAWIVEQSAASVPSAVLSSDSVPGAAAPVLRAHNSARGSTIRYVRFNVPLTAIHAVDREMDFNRALDLRIAVRILGAEQTRLVPIRSGPTAPFTGVPTSPPEGGPN
ncbi:MAG: hypothetical protein ACP5JG_16760, partial [Anaerolineae bacterium]